MWFGSTGGRSGLDVQQATGGAWCHAIGDLPGVIQELQDGGAFLLLGVQGFGGDGDGDLRSQCGGGELGLGQLTLDGGDHAGVIGIRR